jgi:hypothetical protein
MSQMCQGGEMKYPAKGTSRIGRVARYFSLLAAVTAAIIGIINYREGHPPINLTGTWSLEHVIRETTYKPFKGLELGYRINLVQQGCDIQGNGEKRTENGVEMATSEYTQIHFRGVIEGRIVRGTFEEDGKLRRSSGSFRWEVNKRGDSFVGSYLSTAASASGPVRGVRLDSR